MDKVKIDKENLMAVAEAGVTLEKLLNVTESAGLFFPPHLGDEGTPWEALRQRTLEDPEL
jgi:FAD/FMN-containing dehydrogenase